MARARSRLLVIDASVARAAGSKGSSHPTSVACSKFLDEVRKVCHQLVLTEAIGEEWKQHKSQFSHLWLSSMYARKKVRVIRVGEDAAFREHVTRLSEDPAVAAVMHKDCHLIEAARATDNRVVSLDDKVRGHFRALARDILQLRDVCWVNPVPADESALEWLAAGAPEENPRRLGYFPPDA